MFPQPARVPIRIVSWNIRTSLSDEVAGGRHPRNAVRRAVYWARIIAQVLCGVKFEKCQDKTFKIHRKLLDYM